VAHLEGIFAERLLEMVSIAVVSCDFGVEVCYRVCVVLKERKVVGKDISTTFIENV
jgi:hypothetical protein